MAATRDGIEAVIRRCITRVAIATLDGGIPTDVMNHATETILNAIDEYTTAEVGLLTPAERRQVLHQETQ